MKTAPIPVFRGRRALIVHREDRDRQLLQAQLTRLGMVVECRTAVDPNPWPLVDVCFFDADAEKRHTFPWASGDPDVPLIAMIGTETPERIQWNLSHGISAFLVKPVRSNGTYLALMQAEHNFAQRNRLAAELNDMRERVKSRRIVFKVLLRVMKQHGLDEDQAFERLRAMSMQRNVSIEELCIAVVCGESPCGPDLGDGVRWAKAVS